MDRYEMSVWKFNSYSFIVAQICELYIFPFIHTTTQLGRGHNKTKVRSCKVISALRDKGVVVRYIAAGCFHSVAVVEDGMLYVFGRNQHGQLGTGDQVERHTPHTVADFVGKRVLSVAAVFDHTLVLTASAIVNEGDGSASDGSVGIIG